MVREISANYKTCEIQENIQCTDTQSSDLTREDVSSSFPRVKKQLSFFKSNRLDTTSFSTGNCRLCFQASEEVEQKNQRLEISLKKKSVPHSHKLAWMLGSKKKRERLQSMIGFVGDTPFINPEDVENEAFDARNEHVVC